MCSLEDPEWRDGGVLPGGGVAAARGRQLLSVDPHLPRARLPIHHRGRQATALRQDYILLH